MTSEKNLRCWRCKRLLAELITAPYQIRCRCKAVNARGTEPLHAGTVSTLPRTIPPVRSDGYGRLT